MSDDLDMEGILARYDRSQHELRIFMRGVVDFIGEHPDLVMPSRPIIHSYKSRLKDRDHLRAKILRKRASGREITADNLFHVITDLAGVRILHLYQYGFGAIDRVIRAKVEGGDWVFGERPKAYSWDPETVGFFHGFDLDVEQKSTSYTSVHYLVRPRADSPLCCEIQVRTFFEEIWGEVDHQINYPKPCTDVASQEQIKVLSKLVGAGSRLLDSLQRIQKASE